MTIKPRKLAHLDTALGWFDRVDPGVHRRIKGLRLVTAFAIAAMLGTMGDIARDLPGTVSLGLLSRKLCSVGKRVGRPLDTDRVQPRPPALVYGCCTGAASYAILLAPLEEVGRAGPELVLVSGAFCIGYLRRFGLTGTGIGSQIYIGQVLAYGAGLGSRARATVDESIVK